MHNQNFHGAKRSKFNGMAPSRSYTLALEALFSMKLTEDIELWKDHGSIIWRSGWFYPGYKDKTACLDSTTL